MRVSLLLALSAVLALSGQAGAEGPPSLDIQAKRPLPAGKYAVDLASDSELGRDLRRRVMEKLAARGHQVGFSGGHVMKLQVDLTRHFESTLTPESVLVAPRNQLPERNDARPPLPERRMRDLEPKPRAAPETLRITLTLRAAGSGEVIWVAYAACPFSDGRALGAGRNMIDAIFANPNRSRRGEADCPL